VKVCVLGSGSGGNASVVQVGDTILLVDAGFSARDLARRLETVGFDPDSVVGILITHDHRDHTCGMGVFARRHGTKIHLTDRTLTACRDLLRGEENTVSYRPGIPFRIGAIRVEPFITIHDAVDPVGIALVDAETGTRVGIATDLGRPTAQIRHALAGSDFLILEANHDEVLLHQAPYPASVKNRIASSHGHLSNQAAARFALELLHPRLAGILLAHVSSKANRPELAHEVVAEVLGRAGYRGFLEVARQEAPTALIDIEGLRARMGPVQLSFL